MGGVVGLDRMLQCVLLNQKGETHWLSVLVF